MRKLMKKIAILTIILLCNSIFNATPAVSQVFAMSSYGSTSARIHADVSEATGNEAQAAQLRETADELEIVALGGNLETPTGCEQGSDTKCAPYCKYKPVENCFLCPIFATMFNTVNSITARAIGMYSSSVARVVIVAFGIWLALQILRFVSSIETKDLKDLVQAILAQGFIVMLVVVILETGVSSFFNTFLTPIYLTGQNAAQVVFSNTQTDVVETDSIEEIKNGFSPEIGRSVIKTMTTIENAVNKFKALGVSMMCYSWTKEADGILFFPNFKILFTGLILWTFASVLIISLPFLMIDSVFQLGVVGALTPPAIGAAAFKYTRSKYTKPVWETFLNSMFAFVFISMVVLLLLGVLKQALVYDMGNISQAIENAVQAESQANGETPSQTATQASTQTNSQTSDVKALAKQHKQSFIRHEGEKLDVYLDYKGYPTVGIGHLLFREGSFDAWYRDKIAGMEFIKNGRTLSANESKNLFQQLYNSCEAKGHVDKQMKIKGQMTNVKVWGCDANLIKGLKISQKQSDETFEKDFAIAYNKTAKNSKCESSNAEVIWKTFNRGNAGHCGKSQAYQNYASGVTSTYEAKFDPTAFESMFTEGGEGWTYFKEITASFHWASWHFIRLVFVFILAWSVMNMAKEFAGEMAKSISNTSIGSSIGTMAASSAKGMAVKAGKPLAQAVGRRADRAVRRAGRGAANAVAGAWTAHKISKSQAKMKDGPDGKSYVDKKGFKHQMSEDGKTEIISREKVLGTQTQQTVVNGEIRIRSVQRKENLKKYRSKEMTIETKEIVEITQIKDKDGKVIGTPSTKVISVEEKVSFHSISPKDLVGQDGKANTKLLAKLVEGKSPEEKARIQRAVMKKINEQRFAKKHESKLQKAPELIYQNELPDGSIEMTYKLTTAKGEVVLQTMKIRASGFVESHQAITDKNGNVTIMSSDGIRNRMITAKLENAAALNNAKNFDEMLSLTEGNAKKGSMKACYSYTKHYQHMINHGADPRDLGFDENGNQLGMMGWEEAVGKNSAFNNFVNSKGNEFDKARMAADFLV